MAATVEQLVSTLIDIGGEDQTKRVRGRLVRILRGFGKRATNNGITDTFDVTEINQRDGGFYPDMVRRVTLPATQRELAYATLQSLGLAFPDVYEQRGTNGALWVQISPSSDPEFRGYAATRSLLDSYYDPEDKSDIVDIEGDVNESEQ